MTTNTKPTNSDGLDAPHDQPAKSTAKSALILGAIRAFINRATSGFYLDLAIDAYCIMLLILATILLIKGAMQWMQ
jgi:hypothetical protein